MNKTLNDIERDIVEKGIITDEDIDAFREVDTMMSVTTMAWATKTCREAALRLESNKILVYNGKELTRKEFKNLLTENLSDFMVKRIYDGIDI